MNTAINLNTLSSDEVKPFTKSDLASYVPAIKKTLRRFLRPNEIEDACQIVLIRALENFESFRGEATPQSWVCGIARNVAMEGGRKRSKTEISDAMENEDGETESLSERMPDSTPLVEEIFGRTEEHALMLHALETLKLDDQIVILMTYVEGIESKPAGEILDLDHRAFRVRLWRAKKALADATTTLVASGFKPDVAIVARWSVLIG